MRGLEGARVSGRSGAVAEDGAAATPEGPDPALAGARPNEKAAGQKKGLNRRTCAGHVLIVWPLCLELKLGRYLIHFQYDFGF